MQWASYFFFVHCPLVEKPRFWTYTGSSSLYLPGSQLSHWACCSHQPPAPTLSPVLAHLIGHFLIADSFFALQLMILFKDHKAFCQQLAFSWKSSNSLMDLPSKWRPDLHIPNGKMSFSYILGDSPSSLKNNLFINQSISDTLSNSASNLHLLHALKSPRGKSNKTKQKVNKC